MTLGLQNVAEENVLWLQPMSVSKVHKKEVRTGLVIATQSNGPQATKFRLIELSDRVSVSDSLLLTDLFYFLHISHCSRVSMHVSPALSIVKFEDLAYNVAAHEMMYKSDMIMFPWLPPVHDAFDRLTDYQRAHYYLRCRFKEQCASIYG
jgi:hypothetical protein